MSKSTSRWFRVLLEESGTPSMLEGKYVPCCEFGRADHSLRMSHTALARRSEAVWSRTNRLCELGLAPSRGKVGAKTTLARLACSVEDELSAAAELPTSKNRPKISSSPLPNAPPLSRPSHATRN